MVHQAVDRRGRGHLVAEDPVPLAEDQIAGHHHRAALVALGEQREQHLGFVGALLLPFVNGHTDQLEAVQDFLRARQVSVDVFGIARVEEVTLPEGPEAASQTPELSSTFAIGEESAGFGAVPVSVATAPAEVVAPLDSVPVAVRRGESVRVEVVLRTRNVGHFFPGGTVDAFDVWVELEAVDENGRVLLHSGAIGDEGSGPVDPAAHFYGSFQLDGHGNPINKRNAWMTRSVAYVRLVPPGAADTVHYRLLVLEDAGDRIMLRAKVNYRKFDWWLTQWSYAGVRDAAEPSPDVAAAYDDGPWVFTGDTSDVSGPMKEIPDLPTTVMAEAKASLVVVDADAPLPPGPSLGGTSSSSAVRERWNDYGIGLLLQGDLRGAANAFRRVMEIEPDYPDGPVNLARVLIREGDVQQAIPHLETALELDPALARAHVFLGMALRTLGRYDEALEHLETARAQYPRDRVLLGELGRIHFLERRFDEAISTYTDVLRIDPEDLQAHYNLMLAYRGSGDLEQAAREQSSSGWRSERSDGTTRRSSISRPRGPSIRAIESCSVSSAASISSSGASTRRSQRIPTCCESIQRISRRTTT